MGILESRLKRESGEKGLLPETQAGFREGRGTIDNIYVLNYLINRKTTKKKGEMMIMYVDFKAAFDSVDRDELVRGMIKRGVRLSLVKRCEEVLSETSARVRVGKELGGKFWTEKRVRQKCQLSPLLFMLFLADLEEELEKGRLGGVELSGGKKVYSLAYADDIALMARDEGEMRGMIRTLERYVERKKLEVNVAKTKIMSCRKGEGRRKKIHWMWKGKKSRKWISTLT